MSDKIKQKSKVKTIIDAFTKQKTEEEWYLKRLDICSTCSYNSKNVGGILLSIKDVLGASCTACGCFISEKASMREEECGLAEISMTPKWGKLSILVADKKEYSLHNNTPDICRLYLQQDEYFIDFGKVDRDVTVSAQVLLDGIHNVKSVSASCGCTTPQKNNLSKGLTQLDISIKTNNFKGGAVKTVSCIMEDNKKVILKIKANA